MAESTFEARLRARIRDVLNSQEGPHPVWTESPATRRISGRHRRDRWPVRMLGVAALLAIGGGVVAQVGSWQPRLDEPPSPAPTPSANVQAEIPEILRGQFVAQLGSAPGTAEYPFYFIDLEDAVLVHGPGTTDDAVDIRATNGTAADWAGRIVRFTPAGAGSATVVIQAPLPCGEGRYLVRYDEAESPDSRWTLTFTQPHDGCADRLAILVGGSDGLVAPPSASPEDGAPASSVTTARAWTHQPTRLASGERYSSWSFTEPFHFLMPPVAPQAARSPEAAAWTWLPTGRLRIGSVWWRGEFFDDSILPSCQVSLPDIPSSPQVFESWLRSNGRSIDHAVEIEVDGRAAMRYDTSPSESTCPDQQIYPFYGRWYLIPTGDDTILFNVYGDTETEYDVADAIVQSMAFD